MIEGQRSFTTGAFVHQDKVGIRRNLDAFPRASELLARLIACYFPGGVFSSLAFFRDLKQPPHKDTTNGPYDNLLLACSDFSNGGIWIQSDGGSCERWINGSRLSGSVLEWHDRKISFNPHIWHSTEDWEGCHMGFELPGRKKRGHSEPPDVAMEVEDDAEIPEDLPFNELRSGCEGPPLVGDYAGVTDEFVDGFGRCSPGRWKPLNRGRRLSAPAVTFAKGLKERIRQFVLDNVPDLARATFRLATGHWEGPLFAAEAMDKLRDDWFAMLPDPLRAREMIPHQPFFLRAIAQTLQIPRIPIIISLRRASTAFAMASRSATLRLLVRSLRSSVRGARARSTTTRNGSP